MIQIKSLTKIYKGDSFEVIALNGINLNISNGEFVAIMGTSGSGKSTLLNILGCMDILTDGEYELDEYKIHEKNLLELHKIRKEKISFIFQQFALMSHYTVYENVELPLMARNISKKERKELIFKQLEALGIKELAYKLSKNISGGQRQRTAIARALVCGSDIILADEPTGALDQKTGMELMDIFQTINRQGKTLIVVTHDEKVANFAQRIIRIEDGLIISDEKNNKE